MDRRRLCGHEEGDNYFCGACLPPCDACREPSCREHLSITDEAGAHYCIACLPSVAMAAEQSMRLDPALPLDCTRIVTTFLVGRKSLRFWDDALEEA